MYQDQRAVQAAYEEVARTYADHFRANDPELPIERAMIAHFASQLRPPRRILDAGCGPGRMMPQLASLGCRVEGIDLTPAMIAEARAHHSEYPSTVGSLTQLPYANSSFDGYFSWYSSIHSVDDDLPTIFNEAYRVLAPGGLALVAFQEGHGSKDVATSFRPFGHEIQLIRFRRTADEMSGHLARAGFTETGRCVIRTPGQEAAAMVIGSRPPS